MTKKPNLTGSGFTLLELLVAASIFVGVAILSAGAIIATVRIQNAQKVSKNVNVQTERGLEEISFAMERSNGDYPPVIFSVENPESGANPKDEILTSIVYRMDENGAVTNAYERHIYCAEPQYQIPGNSATPVLGKRLVDFWLPQNYYGPAPAAGAFGPVSGAPSAFEVDIFAGEVGKDGIAMGSLSSVSDMQCTEAKIRELYKLDGGVLISSRYLTDPTLNVLNFRVWPVWFGMKTASQSYNVDPPGIRVEMTTQYNHSNTAATSEVEKRVGQDKQVSPQVVSKILINRTTKHSYWP